MKQIESEAIDWVDFIHNKKDKVTLPEGTMKIHFRGKKWVYSYADVPAKVYNEFIALTEGFMLYARTYIIGKYKETKEDA